MMLEMLSWKELSQETKRKILWYEIRFWGLALLFLFFIIISISSAILFISQRISPEFSSLLILLCWVGVWILSIKGDEQAKETPKLFDKIREELTKYYERSSNGN